MISSIRYYYSRFGFFGVIRAIRAKFDNLEWLLEVERKDIKAPFYLRLRTSDIPTFDQIFIDQEYDFETSSQPKIIIDAGANIGLACIYFANKYPKAKIFAIEPEDSNFRHS